MKSNQCFWGKKQGHTRQEKGILSHEGHYESMFRQQQIWKKLQGKEGISQGNFSKLTALARNEQNTVFTWKNWSNVIYDESIWIMFLFHKLIIKIIHSIVLNNKYKVIIIYANYKNYCLENINVYIWFFFFSQETSA